MHIICGDMFDDWIDKWSWFIECVSTNFQWNAWHMQEQKRQNVFGFGMCVCVLYLMLMQFYKYIGYIFPDDRWLHYCWMSLCMIFCCCSILKNVHWWWWCIGCFPPIWSYETREKEEKKWNIVIQFNSILLENYCHSKIRSDNFVTVGNGFVRYYRYGKRKKK